MTNARPPATPTPTAPAPAPTTTTAPAGPRSGAEAAAHAPTTPPPAGTTGAGVRAADGAGSGAGGGGTGSAGAATVARVDATRSWRRVTVDAAGDGWFRLSDRLADPAGLDAWYAAELAGTGRGHRDLAGALIAYRFAGSLAELVIGPLLEQRRVVLLSPGNLSLRLGAGARVEALSVTAPVVAVLAGDPDAGRPGTVVVEASPPQPPAGPGPAGAPGEEGTAALRAVAVDGILAVFGPLAEAVRARAPFGLRGMWGTLADHLADVALRRARDHGGDPEEAWASAAALIDDLAARQPLLRARPTRHDVACPVGPAVFSTKGTCCLIYKTNMPLDRADRADRAAGPASAQPWIDADACTSCPLRSEADRTGRLVRYLTDRAARA